MILVIIFLTIMFIGVAVGLGLALGLRKNHYMEFEVKFRPNDSFRLPINNNYFFYYRDGTPSEIYGSYDDEYVFNAFISASVKNKIQQNGGEPLHHNQIDEIKDFINYEFELSSNNDINIYNDSILRKSINNNKWSLIYKNGSVIHTILYGSYTRETLNTFKLILDDKYKFPLENLQSVSDEFTAQKLNNIFNPTYSYIDSNSLPNINTYTRYLMPITNRFEYFIYDNYANTLLMKEDKTGLLKDIYTYIGPSVTIEGIEYTKQNNWEKWDNNKYLTNITVTKI